MGRQDLSSGRQDQSGGCQDLSRGASGSSSGCQDLSHGCQDLSHGASGSESLECQGLRGEKPGFERLRHVAPGLKSWLKASLSHKIPSSESQDSGTGVTRYRHCISGQQNPSYEIPARDHEMPGHPLQHLSHVSIDPASYLIATPGPKPWSQGTRTCTTRHQGPSQETAERKMMRRQDLSRALGSCYATKPRAGRIEDPVKSLRGCLCVCGGGGVRGSPVTCSGLPCCVRERHADTGRATSSPGRRSLVTARAGRSGTLSPADSGPCDDCPRARASERCTLSDTAACSGKRLRGNRTLDTVVRVVPMAPARDVAFCVRLRL
ncbi:uncharacterized protein LOC119094069 [Pollicipes pollicipes]|uniref:uncharacterized protein LOC119094069 n=1 Tax=Pollicipes pollicipes TaxID=41117 RepID=UPI0018849F1E|nr:uncharacterized protein LOC119094069 [Pollicipes pollicipes]